MESKRSFNRKTIVLSLLCIAPLPIFYSVPEKQLSPREYNWFMFSCAFIGIVVSQLLKTRTREPYENLKRDYSLMPMPSYSKSAIIIRLGYTIGWMGFGVYNTGLGIFLLSLIFS